MFIVRDKNRFLSLINFIYPTNMLREAEHGQMQMSEILIESMMKKQPHDTHIKAVELFLLCELNF